MNRDLMRNERGAVTAERAALMVLAAMVPLLLGLLGYSTGGPSITQRKMMEMLGQLMERIVRWILEWLR